MVSFSFSLCLKRNMFILDPVYVHFIVALFLLRYEKAKRVMLALFCMGEGQPRELLPDASCIIVVILVFSEYHFVCFSYHIDEICKVASNALVCKLHKPSPTIVISAHCIFMYACIHYC